ncbi:Helix-turn-helix domain [uncultured Ruminococcus sp.]|nr:Helix-turn-helix domain [uncultured Clostridium sp.]SCH61823.1 Helix-turn-helix domain [uncultured Ruminococcus sp.]
MFDEFFRNRLAQLRIQKGISARDMSLSMGQGPAYINNIENGRSKPSMDGFYYICDYFHITPQEFFDESNQTPERLQELITVAKKLNDRQLANIIAIIKDITDKG